MKHAKAKPKRRAGNGRLGKTGENFNKAYERVMNRFLSQTPFDLLPDAGIVTGIEVPDGPGVTFGPGKTSKRSSRKPAFWMLPFEVLELVTERFRVGRKYGVNNWKRAGAESDIEYIRNTFDHMIDHARAFLNFHQDTASESFVSEMLDVGEDVPMQRTRLRNLFDVEGESRLSHLAALCWNALTLTWFELHYPELTARAFYTDWREERSNEDL